MTVLAATQRLGILILFLGLVGPARAANLVAEGLQAAELECSACHQVAKKQRPPGPVYDPDEAINVGAPSFDMIARRYAGRNADLKAFIQAPRHPMREQQFTREDLATISAYITSLRGQRWNHGFDRSPAHRMNPAILK